MNLQYSPNMVVLEGLDSHDDNPLKLSKNEKIEAFLSERFHFRYNIIK